MMTMTDKPILLFGILASGPVGAIATQNPEMMIDAGGTSAIGAVAFAMWRLASSTSKHLDEMRKHREQERAEWAREATHRETEREHWGRLTSTLAAHPDHATRSPAR